MASKIQLAAEKHEVADFLLGKGKYHVQGRDDNDEPNDFLYCWESEVIPYALSHNDIGLLIEQALLQLLTGTAEEENLVLYCTVNTLFWYYYFKQKEKISFEMDLSVVESLLRAALLENKIHLENDHRWSGKEWNSTNGLWEPLQRVAGAIKNTYGGIDIVVP